MGKIIRIHLTIIDYYLNWIQLTFWQWNSDGDKITLNSEKEWKALQDIFNTTQEGYCFIQEKTCTNENKNIGGYIIYSEDVIVKWVSLY